MIDGGLNKLHLMVTSTFTRKFPKTEILSHVHLRGWDMIIELFLKVLLDLISQCGLIFSKVFMFELVCEQVILINSKKIFIGVWIALFG